MEVLTLNSLGEFSEKLKNVQGYNKKLTHRYLVPTFWDGRVKKSTEILEQLKKYYVKLLCDPIKYCVRISDAAGFGKTIYEYAPSSTGAQDYQNAWTITLSCLFADTLCHRGKMLTCSYFCDR